jgi:hypothetical protein
MFCRCHRYCFGDFKGPNPPQVGEQLNHRERTGTDKGKPLEREGRKATDLRPRLKGEAKEAGLPKALPKAQERRCSACILPLPKSLPSSVTLPTTALFWPRAASALSGNGEQT